MPAPKRPKYFQSQFLVVRDFQDEQAYHEEMLRRHNRLMHDWGVVRDGLRVTKDGGDYKIEVGSAIDSEGREIVLEKAGNLSAADLTAARAAQGSEPNISITIEFDEDKSDVPEDNYPPPGGKDNVTRMMQKPKIAFKKSPAGTDVILARVKANGDVDYSTRRLAGSFVRGSGSSDLCISTDGKVGIGTKSPNFPLQVGSTDDNGTWKLCVAGKGSTGNYRQWTLRTGDGDNEMDIHKFRIRDEQGAADRLVIDQKGNIGMGTTGPAARLHVEGSGNGMPATTGTAQSAGHVARLKDSSNLILDIGGAVEKGFWLQSTDAANLATNYPLLLNPNGSNVGIGTTAPEQKLHVDGSSEILSTGDGGGFKFRNRGSKNKTDDWVWYSRDNVARLWQAGLGDLLAVTTNGNVGIGATAPATKLHVVGSGNAFPATTGAQQSVGHVARLKDSSNLILDIGGNADKGFWLQSTDLLNLATNYPLLLNPNGGKVGIGTTTSFRTLDLGTSGQLGFGNDGYNSTGSPGLFWYSDNINYGIYKSAGAWNAPNYQQLTLNFPTGIVIDGGSSYGRSGTVLQPNAGNVGIGTTTPKTRLDVNGSIRSHNSAVSGPVVGESGGSGDRLVLWPGGVGSQPYSLGIDNSTLWYSVPGGASHVWYGAGSERMRIDSSGNVKVKGSITIGDWTLECRSDGAWGSPRSSLFIRYQSTDVARFGVVQDMLQLYPLDANLNRHGYFWWNKDGNAGKA